MQSYYINIPNSLIKSLSDGRAVQLYNREIPDVTFYLAPTTNEDDIVGIQAPLENNQYLIQCELDYNQSLPWYWTCYFNDEIIDGGFAAEYDAGINQSRRAAEKHHRIIKDYNQNPQIYTVSDES